MYMNYNGGLLFQCIWEKALLMKWSVDIDGVVIPHFTVLLMRDPCDWQSIRLSFSLYTTINITQIFIIERGRKLVGKGLQNTLYVAVLP